MADRSREKKLNAGVRVLVALLKEQPQKIEALSKSTRVSQQHLRYRVLKRLEERNIIKETEKGYALFDYIELEEKVENVIKKYKEEYVELTLNDIANEVFKPPREIEKYAYALVKKHGVKIGPKRIRRQTYLGPQVC